MIEEDIFRTEPDRDGRSRRYILTEKGEDLYVLLIALWQWGEEHCFETGEPGHVLVDRIGGRPLPRMRPLSASGKIVRPRDFQRSEEHTSELQSLMSITYAVFCLKK